MPNQYEWIDDYEAFQVPEKFDGLDPYSQWSMRHGRAFDKLNDEPVEVPGDFAFFGGVTSSNVASPSRGPGDPGVLQKRQTGGGRLNDGRIPDPTIATSDISLHRLPLRARSLRSAHAAKNATPPAVTWKPPGPLKHDEVVVVAAIDDGINPIHERFRMGAAGTRMDFFWVQDGQADPTKSDLPFGREYQRADLEAALAPPSRSEERRLTELGLLDFSRVGYNRLAFRKAHGTHVLDTAAGAAPEKAILERRLIGVQLPALTTMETSGEHSSIFIMHAVRYILERVRIMSAAAGAKYPVVINFSYGYSGGPHNGRYVVERSFDQLLKEHDQAGGGKACLVLPTGNRQLKRGHAMAQQAPDRPFPLRLTWRAPPADRSPNYLEIWAPTAGAASFDLRITPPGGAQQVAFTVAAGRPRVLARRDDRGRALESSVIARVSADLGLEWPNAARKLKRLLIVLAPTDTTLRGRDPAPSGAWKIDVDAALAPGEQIHAWVQRDEPPSDFPRRGRQSYLEDAGYDKFTLTGDIQDVDSDRTDGFVRRTGTISGLVTGPNVYVVGAYEGRTDQARTSPYSATALPVDPSWPGQQQPNPDFSARADTSRVLRGILGAGGRSGVRVPMNGTSVAAPQVTRLLAGRLASGLPVDREAVQIANAAVDQTREGRGRIPTDPALRFAVERDRPS